HRLGGEVGEVAEVLRQRLVLERRPVGLARLAALHPVRGAAEREDRPPAGLLDQLHAPVEAVPVVLAGLRLRVAGAEAHQVDVLPDRAAVLEDVLAPFHGLVGVVRVEAVLGVRDPEFERDLLLLPRERGVVLDRPQHAFGDRRRLARAGRAGGETGGEHRGEHRGEGADRAHDETPWSRSSGPPVAAGRRTPTALNRRVRWWQVAATAPRGGPGSAPSRAARAGTIPGGRAARRAFRAAAPARRGARPPRPPAPGPPGRA